MHPNARHRKPTAPYLGQKFEGQQSVRCGPLVVAGERRKTWWLPRGLCPGHCVLFQNIRVGLLDVPLSFINIATGVFGVLKCLGHSLGLWCASCPQVEMYCSLFAANSTGSALEALLGLASRWEGVMVAKKRRVGWGGREDYGKWIDDGRRERTGKEGGRGWGKEGDGS